MMSWLRVLVFSSAVLALLTVTPQSEIPLCRWPLLGENLADL